MGYSFKKEADTVQLNSSKICNIYEDYDKDILVLGQLITLFGEPKYISENLENQFSYTISAQDENGNTVFLEIYSAGSGPAIGGTQDERSKAAADALAEYIRSAKPADYDYEGYYMDAPCKIKMGVKNGVPYQTEEELTLSDEEFSVLYKRLYDL